MLDISIKNIDKLPKSKRDELFDSLVDVESKSDGVKCSILKIANNNNISDFIVAYKGEVMYPEEHLFLPDEDIKNESIANSQFKFVFDHLKNHLNNHVDVGVEMLIEFIMRKPTITVQYNRYHSLILVGYTKVKSWEVSKGILKTVPDEFRVKHRDFLAKDMGFDLPTHLFTGKLNTLEKPKNMFLFTPSRYGPIEEGVVITTIDNQKFKWVQENQHSVEHRKEIKSRYEESQKYWDNVTEHANIVLNTVLKDLDLEYIPENRYEEIIAKCSIHMKYYDRCFLHVLREKRTASQQSDDIQGNIKLLARKRIEGNNNALTIGKFRVLTTAHQKMIDKMLEKYDNVILCLITSKDTKDSRDLRYDVINSVYYDEISSGKLSIIEHSTANIFSIMKKANKNINHVVCGSDRFDDYSRMLKNSVGIDVIEIIRNNNISSTNALADFDNIDDYISGKVQYYKDKYKKQYKG